MKLQKINPLFSLLILNIIVCCVFFYPILGHLNEVLLSDGGDGIKNYFTYLYFIKYDFGTHFTGMNYPFGENIVFSDNMPALAWSIAKIKTWFPGIVRYGLLCMHTTFIISYFLCSFYVHKILRLFSVKGWWALASALFITYFSPQFFRLFGHFSLGLVCYFPMMIYWLMQYDRKTKVKYLLYMLACMVLFTFLHVYYLAFGLILILAYVFACWVTKHKTKAVKFRMTVPVLCTIIAAIAVFKLYLKITDPVTDRPAFPIGYLNAGTTGPDILTSGYNFIGHYAFLWLFGGMASKGTEGYTYLGFVTIVSALYLIFRILKSSFVRVKHKIKIPTHPVRAYRKWLIVALLALLFSMGVPFVWGLDFLVEYFSVLRQFRTLGRFSWIFYYLMMIYASVFLYRLFIKMKLKGYRKRYIALLVIILSVWVIEWNGYGQEIRRTCLNAKDNYDRFFAKDQDSWTTWLNQNGYPPEKFQGIIGLPFMHIGSEKLSIQDDYGNIMYFGGQISYQTGLKMVDVMMSRTSWSQTFESVRLCDGPFSPKPIIDRFNDKPFLVFVNHDFPLHPGDKALLQYATLINHTDRLDLYELDLKKMEAHNIRYRDSIKNIALSADRTEGLLLDDSSFVYVNHFDQEHYPRPFQSKGAFAATKDDRQLLATIPLDPSRKDSMYTISTWLLCHNNLPNAPYIIYKQYDKDNKLIEDGDYGAGSSVYVLRYWFNAERDFRINRKASKMELWVAGGLKNYIAADEILIRPVNSIYFYKVNDSTIMLNNRPVNIKR